MIAPLALALAIAVDPPPPPPDGREIRPGHFGQVELHLDLGEPIELDAAGTHNGGRGLFGIGGGFWFPGRVEGGLELRAGSLLVPGLKAVGVDWIHLLLAKGFAPSEGWLLSGGLLLGFYNNSFSLFPDVGLRVRAIYEFERHFDVGLAVSADTAIAEVHDPIFMTIEATIGFSWR